MRRLFNITGASALAGLVYSTSAAAIPVTAVTAVSAGEVGMLSVVGLALAGAVWLARRKQ
jgi:hypothetical protein